MVAAWEIQIGVSVIAAYFVFRIWREGMVISRTEIENRVYPPLRDEIRFSADIGIDDVSGGIESRLTNPVVLSSNSRGYKVKKWLFGSDFKGFIRFGLELKTSSWGGPVEMREKTHPEYFFNLCHTWTEQIDVEGAEVLGCEELSKHSSYDISLEFKANR